jgi:hypothetical protein
MQLERILCFVLFLGSLALAHSQPGHVLALDQVHQSHVHVGARGVFPRRSADRRRRSL